MATLTVQQIALAGITPTYDACTADGDQFPNDGKTYIELKNTDTASQDVVVASPTNCDQGSTHDVTVSIPANTDNKKIGPFPPSRFNDGNGYVQLTYSGVSALTIGAFRLS